jgi:hypothetical protein
MIVIEVMAGMLGQWRGRTRGSGWDAGAMVGMTMMEAAEGMLGQWQG